jgi:murein DD-endopeptidase MepM/ murein hydrolase activator NlpD
LTIPGFHTGLDFGGGDGLPITAPAAGQVVFAGPLTVRGNATIIDHGWGVYSGFWHQSAIQVQVGQMVEQNEVIGLVGGTGRVTGAHLHWELWVNGIQVDPLDWLIDTYP